MRHLLVRGLLANDGLLGLSVDLRNKLGKGLGLITDGERDLFIAHLSMRGRAHELIYEIENGQPDQYLDLFET
jgi:hypothetical protein